MLSRKYRYHVNKVKTLNKPVKTEQFNLRDLQLNQPKLSCPISTESWTVSDLVQFCKYAKRGASEVKKIEFFYSTF